MGKQSIRAIALTAFLAGMGLAPATVRAAEPPSVVSCAKRVTNGAKSFVVKYFEWLGDCEADNLNSDPDEKVNCRAEAAESNSVRGFIDKFFREVDECANDAFRAICPFEAKNAEELRPKLETPPSIIDAMLDLSDEIYVTPYGDHCPRPVGEAPQKAEDCGGEIMESAADYVDELLKCVIKCQLGRMRETSTSELCMDPLTGLPVREKVVECYEDEFDDFREAVSNRCEDTGEKAGIEPNEDSDLLIRQLGCPMNATSVDHAVSVMRDRLEELVSVIDEEIFRSPCKGDLEDVGDETAIPANVTLEPSFTTKQVTCGQNLNSSFFGSDTIVRFDSNLDCTPFGTPTDGIVISKSGVTVSGRGEYRITGPQSKKNRTGTGIRLASGVSNVRIQGFSAIERFAVGIGDAGNNTGLIIDNTTVRRNESAGIRLTSPGAVIEEVKADRNPIGFDLSGDNQLLRESRALRSEVDPGIGVRLGGSDTDGNGRIVRVTECGIEGNKVGVQLNDGPHRVEANSVRSNIGVGIHVASTGSLVDSNSVKANLTDGIWVTGTENEITANRSDENLEDGYVIEGTNNNINNNGSGSLTNNGNLGVGYRIGGTENRIRNNEAAANLGAGFLVEAALGTAQFTSNTATQNQGPGFLFTNGGNELDTNQAALNGGVEFNIAPGNTDLQGNRKNNIVFSFTSSGGTFE